ncbi:MAG: O-antigen ligase family protein [Bacteroidia bacterium]
MRFHLNPKYHYYLYLFGIALLIIGLPFSKFLMSLSQIILFVNWLWEGNLKNKIKLFINNKAALVVSSLLLLHFIGLFYTTDFDYAFKDIKIKLPLFLLPLIFSTSPPVSKALFNRFLQLFIATIITASFFSCFILLGYTNIQILDIRNISIFISHIRFALLIALSILIAFYFLKESTTAFNKLIYFITIIWLLTFLMLMESLTGLAALIATVIIILLFNAFSSKNVGIKVLATSVTLIIVLLSIYSINVLLYSPVIEMHAVAIDLKDHTAQGHKYEHDLKNTQTENGYFIWINNCFSEMETAWNKRSKLDYNGKDLKQNDLRYTLLRFLTSKGFTKDAAAINSLSSEEIKSIERGVANVNYQELSSTRNRINKTLWEIRVYKTTGNPNGHSLTQRFEYWKTAYSIIKQNYFIGVGTGDVQQAFNEEYVKINTPLDKRWRLRAHNQYLTIMVTFGVIGFIWFMITLIYPAYKQGVLFSYLYSSFLLIVLISFLTEDTLETQAGVTFYTFFNSLFLFINTCPKKEK